ncbi:MAG: hypothetical protein M2R45_03887 [Verrucomicrobia subdivision 3 bacterium]|nr:hypothetical protein [Limisphaerales bacterium]MCS1412590.1 hypothetical protein [Limisphaerales bacterium]
MRFACAMNESNINFDVIGYGAWGGYHARAIAGVLANVATLCTCAREDFPRHGAPRIGKRCSRMLAFMLLCRRPAESFAF